MITMVKIFFPPFSINITSIKCRFWKYGVIEHYIEHGESLRDKVNDVADFLSSDTTDILRMALEMEYIPLFGYVWNGFYKRSIIEEHHIQFSSEYIMEDFMFSFEYDLCKVYGDYSSCVLPLYARLR